MRCLDEQAQRRSAGGCCHATTAKTGSAPHQPPHPTLLHLGPLLTDEDSGQHSGAAPVAVRAVHQHLPPRRPLRQGPLHALKCGGVEPQRQPSSE